MMKHLRRWNDTYAVKGTLVCHPPKPTLTKREAIGEGVLDWQDITEQARCMDDGLVIDCESIDWDLTKPPSAPYCTESQRYNVRIAALIDAGQPAKQAKRIEAVEQPIHLPTQVMLAYGSLRQVRTRR